MARTIIIEDVPVALPTGLQQLPERNVPNALERVTMRLKRCTTATPTFWPNASTVLHAEAWLSIDNAPFVRISALRGAAGGILLDDGVEQPEWYWFFTIWPGANRRIRFDIEVENGPLVSEFSLEAE